MNQADLYRVSVQANNTFLRTQEKQILDMSDVINFIKDATYLQLQQHNVIGVKDIVVVFTKDFTKKSPGYQDAEASYENGVLTITIYSKRFLMEQNNIKNAQAEEPTLGQPSNTADVLEELRKLDPDTPLSPLAKRFDAAIGSDQKYAWAGDVFEYLDMYKEDIEAVLGVSDIRLYKDGIRMAVGLLFDAADKYEDKERKKSFKAYIVHKMLAHIDDLTRRVAQGEEMHTAVNQGIQMLTQAALLMRHPNAPSGFIEGLMSEIQRPDAYERAVIKQRHGLSADMQFATNKPGPIVR